METPTEAPKGEAAVAATANKEAEAKVEQEEDDDQSLMDLISGGVYSKSYEETKEALKKNALSHGAQGKKGKKGK